MIRVYLFDSLVREYPNNETGRSQAESFWRTLCDLFGSAGIEYA